MGEVVVVSAFVVDLVVLLAEDVKSFVFTLSTVAVALAVAEEEEEEGDIQILSVSLFDVAEVVVTIVFVASVFIFELLIKGIGEVDRGSLTISDEIKIYCKFIGVKVVAADPDPELD
uniref:Uncharacterized protein n=1 Tax=Panagrolaimus superbus TaxID=310955 RepID=A0A914YIE7_9BILA